MANKQLTAWISCFFSALFFFYTISQLTMFNTISEAFAQSFQLSTSELTILSSSYLYANALWLLPGGMLLDRFKSKNIILFFMALSVLAAFLFSFSKSNTFNMLLRIIEGAASAMSLLACLRLAHDWFENNASSVIGIIISIGLLGGVFANLFYPHALLAYGWRNSIFLNAIMGFIFLAAMFFFIKMPKNFIIRKSSRSLLSAAKIIFQELKLTFFLKENWKCGLYIGLMNLPIFVLAALWGTQFLTQYQGYSEVAAGELISLIFIGELIGAPIMGLLANKKKTKKEIMIIGAIASFILILFIIFSHGKSILVPEVLFFLLGFSISAQVLGYPLIVENNQHSISSTATGFGSLLSNSTGAIMQIIFGLILVSKTAENHLQYTQESLLKAILLLPLAFLVCIFIALTLKKPSKATNNF